MLKKIALFLGSFILISNANAISNKTDIDQHEIIQSCSTAIDPDIMEAVIHTESSYNPFAIGVVNGKLSRQPRNLSEAISTVRILESKGKNYSVGFAQVNKKNFRFYNLNESNIFDPCKNIQVGSMILRKCYDGALLIENDSKKALKKAFSCYYSGNYQTGFIRDFPNQEPYVNKVMNNLKVKSDLDLGNRKDDEKPKAVDTPVLIDAKKIPENKHQSWDVFNEFNGDVI